VSEPLVSLVMPAWTPDPAWLREAVRSALDQQGCRVEVIVIDDGSPEPVERALAELADARLRVLRVDHGGESAARNAGIAAAAGTHLRFIDADDVLERGSTARLLRLLGADEDVIAYGATMFCDGGLRPLWKLTCRLEGAALEDCLLGRFTVRPFALLFPRRVVEATGEWDTGSRVSHDWDYVLRALEHALVRGETETAVYYRKHPGSATADAGVVGETGARRVVDRYFARHPEQRGTALERKAYARLDAMLARMYATKGDLRRSAAALARAAKDPPAIVEELRQAAPAAASTLTRRLADR
jgi:glycosyltransferase involved in cell wall biosynthesis